MRVLSISADRSKRGVLYPGTSAFKRQEAYAKEFGSLDIIGFSRKKDGAKRIETGALRVFPTNSISRFFYGLDAIRIARTLPKPDVVTVQDPFETGIIGWWIARKFQVPLHVQIHTDFHSPRYQIMNLMNYFRVNSGISHFVLRQAKRIRVVSERVKQEMLKTYPFLRVPISVLPIFANIEAMRVGLRDHALDAKLSRFGTKLLVVARLEHEKNVLLALLSFASSAPRDTCLVIVGSGKEMNALENHAKDLNVRDRVFFEGEKDATPYYTLADLILVPSLYEGYGLVIVEALAAGKPVLSTDVGIAREAGAIVTTEEKFADSLAKWFENGPRTGELKNYPYKNFDEYVRAYCDDIKACVKAEKTQ